MDELKKMLDAVSLQLVILIVSGIASIWISHSLYSGVTTINDLIAMSASPLSIVSLLLGIVGIVVTGWAGFVWVKESKGTAVDGGKAGALVSVISGIITGFLSMVYVYPMMDKFFAVAGMPGGGSSFGVITYIIGIVVSAIVGFILGAIGGYVAKNK